MTPGPPAEQQGGLGNVVPRSSPAGRRLARERGVPAYVVFSDASLRDMAARRPRTGEEFLEVSGVGEKKLEQFGQTFLDELAAWEQREER